MKRAFRSEEVIRDLVEQFRAIGQEPGAKGAFLAKHKVSSSVMAYWLKNPKFSVAVLRARKNAAPARKSPAAKNLGLDGLGIFKDDYSKSLTKTLQAGFDFHTAQAARCMQILRIVSKPVRI